MTQLDEAMWLKLEFRGADIVEEKLWVDCGRFNHLCWTLHLAGVVACDVFFMVVDRAQGFERPFIDALAFKPS